MLLRRPLAGGVGKVLGRNWAACFWVVMLVVFSFASSNFLSISNFQEVVHHQTLMLLLAAAETFVIITGGIDLSIGFVAGLASVVAARLMQALIAAGLPTGWVIALGAAGALALSLLPGLV